jgi:hypothetical protein
LVWSIPVGELAVEVAFIPPFDMLGVLKNYKYQLMLPQLVEFPQYTQTYYDLCRDPDKYVILDNGAAEDVPISGVKLLNTANIFGVDEIVAPDVLSDASRTFVRSDAFFRDVSRMNQGDRFTYGYVLQGKTVEECLEHVRRVLRMDWNRLIGVWYIPRILIQTSRDPYARVKLSSMIPDTRPVHFLGMNPGFPEELMSAVAQREVIRSIDTSLPFVYAMHGYSVQGEANPFIRRPFHYFEGPWHDPEWRQRAFENCKTIEGWAKG